MTVDGVLSTGERWTDVTMGSREVVFQTDVISSDDEDVESTKERFVRHSKAHVSKTTKDGCSLLEKLGNGINNNNMEREVGKVDVQASCSLPSDVKTCRITGVTSLPDDRLLVLDSANCRIKLLDKTLQVTKYKIVGEKCHSICCISETSVGVLKADALYIFSIFDDTINLEEKLSLTGMHYGICSNLDVFVLVKLITIDIYDKSYSVTGTVNFSDMLGKGTLSPNFMSISDDNDIIFYDDSSKHYFCMNMNGTILWKTAFENICYGIHCFNSRCVIMTQDGLFEISCQGKTQKKVADVSDLTFPEKCFSSLSLRRPVPVIHISDGVSIFVFDLH